MFQHFSSFKVVTHDLHHTRLNNADFREIVTTMESIFAKSFITRVWSHKSIKEHLSDCPQIQIGYIDAEPIFYCSILLRTFHKNRDYLWINSMAIDKLYQNQGLATWLYKFLLTENLQVEWLGGRTQNPNVIRLREKFCYPIFPLHLSYLTAEGEEILNYSKATIRECQVANSQGVCYGVYRNRLGDFPSRNDLHVIQQLFADLQLDANRGDGLIVIGKVRRTIEDPMHL